jgi:small-conductance mechanosensitive channel
MDINFIEIIQGVLMQFAEAIPGIVGAIVIFVIFWIVASIVAKLISKMLSKVGIDKFADNLNQIDLFAKMKVDMKPSSILSKIAYYLLLLIGAMVAAEVSGMQELSDLMEQIINYAPKVLSAGIIMIIGLVVADFIKKMIVTACDSVGVPSGRIIGSFVFYFIFVTVIITAMKQIGIPTELVSTNVTIIILGIVLAFSIGYGFASRKVMASILSSFFYTKGKIDIGNVIKINGVKGEVISMDSTSITLKIEENSKVLIPLSRFAENDVEIFN